jgi:hypothetical protein
VVRVFQKVMSVDADEVWYEVISVDIRILFSDLLPYVQKVKSPNTV